MSNGGMTPIAPGSGDLTGSQIANWAWRVTKDEDSSDQRVDPALMLIYVNAALVALNGDLPELLLSADGDSMDTFATLSDLSNITVFSSDRLKTLASYVVGLIYQEDSQDDRNLEMSKQHFAVYQQGVNANV